jgi:hypothetical protein
MATITKRVGVKGTTYNAKVRIKGHPHAHTGQSTLWRSDSLPEKRRPSRIASPRLSKLSEAGV